MQKSVRFWIFSALLLFSLLLIGTVSAAEKTDTPEIITDQVTYTFGEEIVFEVQLDDSQQLEQADIILQAPGTPSFVGAMSISTSGKLLFSYNLAERPLPAFAPVTYTYRLLLENGQDFSTEPRTFTYLDQRFNWQQLEDDPFEIYWYEGDLPFAREVLDAAQSARKQVLELLQQPEDGGTIRIFVYNSPEALQDTLASTNQSWVAGHAAPELGAAVVSLPAGVDQSLEIQRQIPHEITHVMLYRFMGAEYRYLPVWVSEGIASLMEFYSHPDYGIILEKAQEENSFIPLNQLCGALPTDPDLIRLAYAESDSVLRYIRQEYGVTGVQALIAAYDQGVSCERGVEIALGNSLKKLEREWKQAVFYRSRNLLIIGGLSLVLLVLIAVLVVIIVRKVQSGPDEQQGIEDE